jgi:hypothetical protein
VPLVTSSWKRTGRRRRSRISTTMCSSLVKEFLCGCNRTSSATCCRIYPSNQHAQITHVVRYNIVQTTLSITLAHNAQEHYVLQGVSASSRSDNAI